MDPLGVLEAKRRERWAHCRAQAVAKPREVVTAICGRRWITTRCGCGPRERPVGCDQAWICEACATRKRRRLRGRATRALKALYQGARRATRGRASCYLVTLTVPHSGDIAVDTARIKRAWREVSRRATWLRRGYLGVVEATAGTAGDGHVHLHVAVIAEWIPYADLHAAWDRAVGHAGTNLDVRRKSVAHAATYVAKYATKGADLREMPGAVAGRFLAAMRGRRAVFTSRGFWQPHVCRCKECRAEVKLISAPSGADAADREASWLALAERYGVRLPRGAPQAPLAWPGSGL